MGDQKRWFKVWSSIGQDPSFLSLPMGDLGRWTALGAWIAVHGTRGTITAPEPAIRHVLRIPENVTIAHALRLPNVSFEEGKNRHGEFTVTMDNWVKYQNDSTQAERQKTSRSKRRGEEKRREEKKKERKDIAPSGLTGEAFSPDILVEAWNDLTTPPIPKIKKLTEGRRQKIRTRIRDRTLSEWRDVIQAVERTPFLRGDNNRGWTASFDWLIGNAENAVKVIEGRYESNGKGGFDQEAELRKFVESET